MKKKILLIIISVLMAVFFAGCSTFTPPSSHGSSSGITGGGQNGGGGEDDDPGNKPGGGTDDPGNKPGGNTGGEDDEDDTFTVTLMLNGARYTNTAGIQARWQNKYGMYSADFVNGVASIKGLDGEYHVSLSDVPKDGNDYTYDKNGITANNRNKKVTVELLKVLKAEQSSMDWYEIRELGTYRAQLLEKPPKPVPGNMPSNSKGEYKSLVPFYFYPEKEGWYTITSWVDTEENKVNPILYRYNGNPFSGFSVYDTSIDGGGTSGTYTKNFKLEYKIYGPTYDENGNMTDSGQVGNAQLFCVGAESAKGYPVTVEFTVKYEGEYYNPYKGDPVYAEGPFYTGSKPSGTFKYNYRDTGYVLTGSRFKLNPDDGYYHLYDEDAYATNGGWGPLLYAVLTKDNEVFQTFDFSNPPKPMNMGFTWNHLNDGNISCVLDGKDYAYMITSHDVTIYDANGKPVIDEKTKLPKKEHIVGYSEYCNSDGAHPVTEEIKNFLQGYASREFFFNDGEGWAETGGATEKLFLNSLEDDQWLFACGYYV